MWICKSSEWNVSHTDLSQYFIEKLKQQVDPSETISNKHRTTNGLTLIKEIITISEMTKVRPKFKNRLASVLNESKEKSVPSNILNDPIIKKYFPDVANYYSKIDIKGVVNSEKELNFLIHKSKIFYARVRPNYLKYILAEVDKIDFKSDKFIRESRKIDQIISCFTTYVLYLGYSATSISEVSYRYIFKFHGVLGPKRIIAYFNERENEFKFLFKTKKKSEEFSFIREKINEKKVKVEQVKLSDIKDLIVEEENLKLEKGDELFEFTTTTLDPHNFIRFIYDQGLKRYVANRDRKSLDYFIPFFDNVYWRFGKATGGNKHKYQSSRIWLDPINVPQRPNTLHTTLERLSKDFGFEKKIEKGLPAYKDLMQPLYFYNLAIGSKSIENSISLLWTSLEILIPYRLKEYDIENAQHFVSKSLAVGSIGRELMSFVQRFVETNNLNQNKLSTDVLKANYTKTTPNALKLWANWLGTNYENVNDEDPYDSIKECSNLLCKEFCKLNNLYSGKEGTVNYWLDKIKASELSIKYQLDRIYLHRNQIVHSGKFINEYSNLWSHLEWYVGKLLSYAIVRSIKESKSIEDFFIELHGDNEQVITILTANRDKKVSDMKDYFDDVFKHTWQMI